MNPAALVTGASGGIGYELAKLLAKDHYDLIIVARRLEKLNSLQAEVQRDFGVKVHVIPADLTVPGIAHQVVQEIQAQDRQVQVLVNNAGIGAYGRFSEIDEKRLYQMLQLNIVALTELTRLLLPSMLERKTGRILNVASTAAFQPGPLMAVYYATKAYVLSFSEAIANEVKGSGVTVTTLCPGLTATGFQDAAGLQKSGLLKFKKMATAEEVARFGYKAMLSGRPVAVHGLVNSLITQSVRFMPRAMTTTLVRAVQEGRP